MLLKPGKYFMRGNDAAAEGALLAGCRFYSGYPITPSTELMEKMSQRMPEVGGTFIQMEDELSGIAAAIGASWAGKKAMTATSGPGISLMQENIGFAIMTETPLVIVDSQRGGPSTGQPTVAAHGDVMSVHHGTHGDYETLALAPNSVQEFFESTIKAFNLSEMLRMPVFVMADAELSHIMETLTVPDDINIVDRKKHPEGVVIEKPFEPDEDLIPPFPVFGNNNMAHVTGLTHDERGYPDTISAESQERLVNRLIDKVHRHHDAVNDVEIINPDADIIVVAYGILSRAVYPLTSKVGLFRPKTLWPFPEKEFLEVAKDKKHILVIEMNAGQYVREVERYVDRDRVKFKGYLGGKIPTPHELNELIERWF